MTDPVPNDQEVNEEQVANFGWWLIMLPFVVGAGVFTYIWWQHRLDAGAGNNLIYALGVLILGVVIAALSAGGSDDGNATGSGGTSPKIEE